MTSTTPAGDAPARNSVAPSEGGYYWVEIAPPSTPRVILLERGTIWGLGFETFPVREFQEEYPNAKWLKKLQAPKPSVEDEYARLHAIYVRASQCTGKSLVELDQMAVGVFASILHHCMEKPGREIWTSAKIDGGAITLETAIPQEILERLAKRSK
jgi:hypothetical protein